MRTFALIITLMIGSVAQAQSMTCVNGVCTPTAKVRSTPIINRIQGNVAQPTRYNYVTNSYVTNGYVPLAVNPYCPIHGSMAANYTMTVDPNCPIHGTNAQNAALAAGCHNPNCPVHGQAVRMLDTETLMTVAAQCTNPNCVTHNAATAYFVAKAEAAKTASVKSVSTKKCDNPNCNCANCDGTNCDCKSETAKKVSTEPLNVFNNVKAKSETVKKAVEDKEKDYFLVATKIKVSELSSNQLVLK